MLDKLPFLAIIGAILVTIVYMRIFDEWSLTRDVLGVFIVAALVLSFVSWLWKRRKPPKTGA